MTSTAQDLQKRLEFLENAIASLTTGQGPHDHVGEQRCGLHDSDHQGALPDHGSQAHVSRSAAAAPVSGRGQDDILNLVEAVIASRRQRLKFFDPALFFDPSWTMLLDLFRAELRQKQVSVSSVCYASGVPETTALRYIRVMEDQGYLTRMPDPTDRRRVFLCLTPTASERLTGYFTKLGSDFSFADRRAAQMTADRATRQAM
jgi:hypothetical protein